MQILVIVPAYNESENIASVIRSVTAQYAGIHLIVVNDCSTDATSYIARKERVIVADLPVNLGIGGAVQTGFMYAQRQQYDIALQFDGDGQHRAEDIPALLQPITSGKADVVIGSRFCGESEGFKSTPLRQWGIKLFELINSLLIHQRITDNTSGFRAYNKKAIAFLAQHYPSDYPEPEAVILLGKNGFRIKEVPVTMKARQGGRSSIAGVRSLYYMFKVMFAVFMCSIRKRLT